MIDLQQPLVIYGAGRFGQDLCRLIRSAGGTVVGFLISASEPTTPELVLEVPVHAVADPPVGWAELQLACGVFNRETPLSDLSDIARSAGFHDMVMPWTIAEQFGEQLGWRYWLTAPSKLATFAPRLQPVLEHLADAESRRIVESIFRFRMGGNIEFSSFRSTEEQYFNPLTFSGPRGRGWTYVDCGAFNGDTFRAFRAAADCAAAYLFEPDPGNFVTLTRSVEGLQMPVHCLPLAVTDEQRLVSFSMGDGEASSLSESGSGRVMTVALDDVLTTISVDFLKVDVEGADLLALKGATRIISRSRPVIAISLYHNPHDLWEIPLAAYELCADYAFFVRQHFFNTFDSVLYAVPREHLSELPFSGKADSSPVSA